MTKTRAKAAPAEAEKGDAGRQRGRIRTWARLLFVVPFIAILWVPSYNRVEPALLGVPFFYWYQLAWILVGAAIALTVYAIEIGVTHQTGTSRPTDVTGTPGDIL